MKTLKLLCILFVLCKPFLHAQSNFVLPTIIPPSPEAQAFMRYGEIPVDYSTGVPNISIPLYTVKGKKLELPLSISYHSSGIKLNDVASEIGLGWVLNCGGMVSRTVNGTPDEWRTGTRTYCSAKQLLDAVAANAPIYDNSFGGYLNILNFENFFNYGFEDPMTDRFFYQLPNGPSGIFRNDYLNDNNIITLPYRKLRIEKFLSPPSPYEYRKIDSLKITDENGTVYSFKSTRSVLPRSYSEWYLSKMISADGSDTIRFFYDKQEANSSISTESFALTVRTSDLGSNCLPSGTPYSSISKSISPSTTFDTPVLTKIVSSNAIIDFIYDNITTKARSDFSQLHRLSEITISPINSPSNIIRSVHFTPKYFGSNSNNYRLGLENVIISAPGDPQPQKYEFTYEENPVLPDYPFKMTSPRYSEDFWGYYNGSDSPNLIQSDFAREVDKPYCGNRNPDPDLSRACMIKEIKYPTGGRTAFHFERNYAEGVYPNGYVGGFRVGNIANYNKENEVVGVKTYEYSGAVARQITKELFWYIQNSSESVEYIDPQEGWKRNCWVQSTDDVVLSDPLLPLEVGAGLPIMYTRIIEYNGTKTNNAGKTVYEYNRPHSPSDFFANPEHPLNFEEARFYHPGNYDKGNYTPELISKQIILLMEKNTIQYLKQLVIIQSFTPQSIKLE